MHAHTETHACTRAHTHTTHIMRVNPAITFRAEKVDKRLPLACVLALTFPRGIFRCVLSPRRPPRKAFHSCQNQFRKQVDLISAILSRTAVLVEGCQFPLSSSASSCTSTTSPAPAPASLPNMLGLVTTLLHNLLGRLPSAAHPPAALLRCTHAVKRGLRQRPTRVAVPAKNKNKLLAHPGISVARVARPRSLALARGRSPSRPQFRLACL